MKKLINKKTGEIAYIDLYFNTITFSKSKTTHKISIQKDPNTNQITKITSSPDPIPNPNPIPEPIINKSSEPSNTSTPNTNDSSSESNNIPTPTIKKSNSKHKSTNKTITPNDNEPEFMDEFSIYEIYPETEIFESPDSINNMTSKHIYKIPAWHISNHTIIITIIVIIKTTHQKNHKK